MLPNTMMTAAEADFIHRDLQEERSVKKASSSGASDHETWTSAIISARMSHRLIISSLRNSVIPPEVFEIEGLTFIGFGNVGLSNLPDSFTARQSGLAELDCGGNALATLPLSLRCCAASMTALHVDRNPKMVALPDVVAEFVHLERFNVHNCSLASLSATVLGSLKALRVLCADSNSLRELPDVFGRLVHLRELDLSHNLLQALPPSLAGHAALEILRLSNNQLEAFPPALLATSSAEADKKGWGDIWKVVSTAVSASTGGASAAPPASKLRILEMDGNRIRAIPDAITAALPRLERLILSYNQIEVLPASVSELSALKDLHLIGNPLKRPPLSFILEHGIESLKPYYQSQREVNLRAKARHIAASLGAALLWIDAVSADGEGCGGGGAVIMPASEMRVDCLLDCTRGMHALLHHIAFDCKYLETIAWEKARLRWQGWVQDIKAKRDAAAATAAAYSATAAGSSPSGEANSSTQNNRRDLPLSDMSLELAAAEAAAEVVAARALLTYYKPTSLATSATSAPGIAGEGKQQGTTAHAQQQSSAVVGIGQEKQVAAVTRSTSAAVGSSAASMHIPSLSGVMSLSQQPRLLDAHAFESLSILFDMKPSDVLMIVKTVEDACGTTLRENVAPQTISSLSLAAAAAAAAATAVAGEGSSSNNGSKILPSDAEDVLALPGAPPLRECSCKASGRSVFTCAPPSPGFRCLRKLHLLRVAPLTQARWDEARFDGWERSAALETRAKAGERAKKVMDSYEVKAALSSRAAHLALEMADRERRKEFEAAAVGAFRRRIVQIQSRADKERLTVAQRVATEAMNLKKTILQLEREKESLLLPPSHSSSAEAVAGASLAPVSSSLSATAASAGKSASARSIVAVPLDADEMRVSPSSSASRTATEDSNDNGAGARTNSRRKRDSGLLDDEEEEEGGNDIEQQRRQQTVSLTAVSRVPTTPTILGAASLFHWLGAKTSTNSGGGARQAQAVASARNLVNTQEALLKSQIMDARKKLALLQLQPEITAIDEREQAAIEGVLEEVRGVAAQYKPLSPIALGWYALLHGKRHSQFIAEALKKAQMLFIQEAEERAAQTVLTIFKRVRTFSKWGQRKRLRGLFVAWKAAAAELKRGGGLWTEKQGGEEKRTPETSIVQHTK